MENEKIKKEYFLNAAGNVVSLRSEASYTCTFNIEKAGDGTAISGGITNFSGLHRFNNVWQCEQIQVSWDWFYTRVRVIIHHRPSDDEVLVSYHMKSGSSKRMPEEIVKVALECTIPKSIELMKKTSTVKEFLHAQAKELTCLYN